MRNRVEVPLSNQTFSDITAWRAIRNAEKQTKRSSPRLFATESEFRANPTTLFTMDTIEEHSLSQTRKNRYPQTARITELNQTLENLWKQRKSKQITRHEYSNRHGLLVSELNNEMQKVGHRPVRVKENYKSLTQ